MNRRTRQPSERHVEAPQASEPNRRTSERVDREGLVDIKTLLRSEPGAEPSCSNTLVVEDDSLAAERDDRPVVRLQSRFSIKRILRGEGSAHEPCELL